MAGIFDEWPDKYDLWFETPMGPADQEMLFGESKTCFLLPPGLNPFPTPLLQDSAEENPSFCLSRHTFPPARKGRPQHEIPRQRDRRNNIK